MNDIVRRHKFMAKNQMRSLHFMTEVNFDFWYDKAAFHFLTIEERIDKYVHLAEKDINQHGYLILGTFSKRGPLICRGLELKPYSETSMANRFEKRFKKIKCIAEEHQTPFSTTQHFLFCSFRKKPMIAYYNVLNAKKYL